MCPQILAKIWAKLGGFQFLLSGGKVVLEGKPVLVTESSTGSSHRDWYRFRYQHQIALVDLVPVPIPVRNSVPVGSYP